METPLHIHVDVSTLSNNRQNEEMRIIFCIEKFPHFQKWAKSRNVETFPHFQKMTKMGVSIILSIPHNDDKILETGQNQEMWKMYTFKK